MLLAGVDELGWRDEDELFRQPQPLRVLIAYGLHPQVVPLLDEAEEVLTRSQFFGGSSFGLADVYWMACISVLMDTQKESLVRSRPQLSAWWDRTSARPSWQTTKQR